METDVTHGVRTVPIWGVVCVTLTLGTLVSASLATIILDALLEGPAPASVTTRVPGFVYASATVMKVCIVVGSVMAVVALLRRALIDRERTSYNISEQPEHGFPIWGVTSVAVAPLTPLVGAVVVVFAQAFAPTPRSLSMIDLSNFSRTAVIVDLLLLSCGVVAAVASLVRREHPRPLPALGLVTDALLIGLFCYLRFYAVGFDQDTWAPR